MKKRLLLITIIIVIALTSILIACSENNNLTNNVEQNENNNLTNNVEQNENNNSNEDIFNDNIQFIYVIINDNKLKIDLENNKATNELVEHLKTNDIQYIANDYGNFEKVGDLPFSLTKNDIKMNVQAGDVVLYLGNKLCLYYGQNSWEFTKIGRINGYNENKMRDLLGAGNGQVEVILTLE